MLYSLSSARGRAILAAVTLTSSMAFLLGSALGVALPAIQSAFGTELNKVQWVMNAHLLVESALLPGSGALADIYGRRRLFLAGIALFTLGGLGAAFVPDIFELILCQAVQGLGGALMIPGSLALIQTHFAEEQRGLAIGIWAGVSAAMASVGPPLAGFLVAGAGWRAVFLLVVPLGLLAFIATLVAVPPQAGTARQSAGRPDPLGTVLAAVALFGISYALIFAPDSGWTAPGTATAAATGGLALLAFVVWQRVTPSPMIPGRLFDNRDVTCANLITLCLYCALNGTITFSIFYLQQIQKFSPQAAGIAILPVILIIALCSGPGGMFADRAGLRTPLIYGTLTVGAGMFWIAATILVGPVLSDEPAGFAGGRWNYYAWHYLPGLCLLGGGMSLVIAPVSRAALQVSDELTGTASGVNNAASRVASLLSVALLGAVLTQYFIAAFEPALRDLNADALQANLAAEVIDNLLAAQGKLGAIVVPDTLTVDQQRFVRAAIARAFHHGYVTILFICAGLAWISSALAAALMRKGK